MKKAVFLDRDGTIIRDKGYINKIENVSFYDFAFDSLRRLQQDFVLFIVTNQQGIAEGQINLQQLKQVHGYILDRLKKEGIEIQEIFTCPHSKADECQCRKPSTHFAMIAKDKYNLDLTNSYMLGDHLSDVNFGLNAGMTGIFLLTGHGTHHYDEAKELSNHKVKICRSLRSATDWIMREES